MTYFRVNAPNVIHEIIDGEAVVVNLQSGSYYSIDGIGAAVWDYLERGLSDDQIIDVIADQYSGDLVNIDEGIQRLLTQLQTEQLIVHTEAPPSNGNHSALNKESNVQNKPPFEAPALHKYTDMEDLLLLDPIHDVDEKGWPNLPEKR